MSSLFATYNINTEQKKTRSSVRSTRANCKCSISLQGREKKKNFTRRQFAIPSCGKKRSGAGSSLESERRRKSKGREIPAGTKSLRIEALADGGERSTLCKGETGNDPKKESVLVRKSKVEQKSPQRALRDEEYLTPRKRWPKYTHFVNP